MIALLAAAQVMEVPASGIPQAVPATQWSCEMTAADQSRFTLAGTTPLFPKGADPNRSETMIVESTHPEAYRKHAGVRPREAGEWFREFQVSSGYPGVPQYELNLMLRREGASVAYMTRYMSNKQQLPYEYYAVGLCKAQFNPSASGAAERGSL
jgi:hypothetical protein